jgi:hypothetical protein
MRVRLGFLDLFADVALVDPATGTVKFTREYAESRPVPNPKKQSSGH